MPLTDNLRNIRTQGVVGVNADPNNAPPNTLLHCAQAQVFAIQMGDERGKLVQTVIYKIGDSF